MVLTGVEREWRKWPGQRGRWRPDTKVLPVAAATAGAEKKRVEKKLVESLNTHHTSASLINIWFKMSLWGFVY